MASVKPTEEVSVQYHGSGNWYKQVADAGPGIEHLPISEPTSMSGD